MLRSSLFSCTSARSPSPPARAAIVSFAALVSSAALVSFVAGCSSREADATPAIDGGADGVVNGAPEESTWCATFAAHRCAIATSCCGASWSADVCLADAKKQCEDLRSKASVLGLPFSAPNARACLDATTAAFSGCKTPPEWHPSMLTYVADCGSVWNGSRALGETCTTTAECAQDLTNPVVCGERCSRVELVDIGANCGQLSSIFAMCAPGLVCAGPAGTPPFCGVPYGSTPCLKCASGDVCRSDGKCGKPLADGAYCDHGGECASQVCNAGVCGWKSFPEACAPVVEPKVPSPPLQGCTRDPGAPAPNPARQKVETFTVEDALAGFPATSGRLVAKFVFTRFGPPGVGGPPPGDLVCVLEEKRAPIAVATFVGLARGLREYRKDMVSPFLYGKFFEGFWFPEHRSDLGLIGGTSDPAITPGYDLPRENGGMPPKAGTLIAEPNKFTRTPSRTAIGHLNLWLTDAYATEGTQFAHCDLDAARALVKEDFSVRIGAVEIARCP